MLVKLDFGAAESCIAILKTAGKDPSVREKALNGHAFVVARIAQLVLGILWSFGWLSGCA
jgi:hypothetical protein